MKHNAPFQIMTHNAHRTVAAELHSADYGKIGDDVGEELIGDVVAAIRRRVLALGLWVSFCIVVGIGYVAVAEPEYVATAQIALEPRLRLPPGVGADVAATTAAPMLDSAQADSQVQIVRSARNLRYVFDTLKLEADPAYAEKKPGLIKRVLGLMHGSPPSLEAGEAARRRRETAFQDFSNAVQVRRLGTSYVLEVAFRGLHPADTSRITNSIAAAYIRDQVLVHAATEQRGMEFLQGRISMIQSEKKSIDEAVLTGIITDFQYPDSDARIVGAALTPLIASYPQTKLILLMCAFGGLITGVALIAIMHNFDRTVRSAKQIRRLVGVDCLITVPCYKSGNLTESTVLSSPESEFASAIRLLRTNLFAGSVDSSYISIGFVGCHDETGCSILSANLANLLAASGYSPVLVDANLRRPDLTRRIAPKAIDGLDSVLFSLSTDRDLPKVELNSTLSFVPAFAGAEGGRQTDANTFLGTPSMRAALIRLSIEQHVIIDLPSFEAASDAQAIGSSLAGIVIVATINRTTIDQIVEAVRALHSSKTNVLGVVLNNPRRSRRLARMVLTSH